MASMTSPQPQPMNVQVSGRRIDLGEALRTRIASELVTAIGKYFDRGGSAEVVVGRDGHSFCVDMVVVLASGQQLVARGLGGDAHSAFDTALTKIEARIRRYKRRLVNHHHHNAAARTPTEITSVMVLRAPEDDDEFDEDWSGAATVSNGAPEAMIIAETEATVKTLTVSMAVMELDLTGAPVQLFRNAAHGGLSVVYRRPDGNIGWIDPERTRSRALS